MTVAIVGMVTLGVVAIVYRRRFSARVSYRYSDTRFAFETFEEPEE
jgi:hypothetical protein